MERSTPLQQNTRRPSAKLSDSFSSALRSARQTPALSGTVVTSKAKIAEVPLWDA